MTTDTFQPNETNSNDAQILHDNPDTNYGTGTSIGIGENNTATQRRRTLIKFDISSIPSNAIVSSAKLYLRINLNRSSNARDFKMYRVLRDWVESEMTWNDWSTGNAWTTGGCGSDGNDADLTNVWATTSYTASESVGTVKEYDIDTDLIEGFIDGTYNNYGWVLLSPEESNDLYNHDSAGSATAANRPKLVITYTVPGEEEDESKFFLMF